MSLETAIKARLDGYAGLSALVGSRNYAVTRPQGTALPATVSEVISDQAMHAMGSDAVVHGSRVEVSSFGETFGSCRAVDEQVRQALSRYRGTSGSTVIQDILEQTVNDIFHGEVNDGIYQRARAFLVFYEV